MFKEISVFRDHKVMGRSYVLFFLAASIVLTAPLLQFFLFLASPFSFSQSLRFLGHFAKSLNSRS